MKQLTFLLLIFQLSLFSFGQSSKLLTGLVLSETNNRPLEGVTVWVKGTTNISGTQPDGVYFIDVKPTDSILVFSYAGHSTTEVRLAGDSEYSVTLRREPVTFTRKTQVADTRQKQKMSFR